jgi:polar amino acid transport system substrate-binding protein
VNRLDAVVRLSLTASVVAAAAVLAGCEPPAGEPEAPAAAETQEPFARPDLAIPPRSEKRIVLVADAWPPYNNDVGSEREGFMIDVARAVFEPRGYEVDYLNVPWRRALAGTRDGTYDGAVAASRTEGPELVFPECELLRTHPAFYVRSDSTWEFRGPSSLDGVALGAIRGYDYVDWLNNYIDANQGRPERVQVVSGDSPLQQNLRKLVAGRIDVLVDNEGTIRYVARQLGLLDRIRPAGSDPTESLCYIPFSPATGRGQEQAAILSRGIRELHASGELARLLSSYDIPHWETPCATRPGDTP